MDYQKLLFAQLDIYEAVRDMLIEQGKDKEEVREILRTLVEHFIHCEEVES